MDNPDQRELSPIEQRFCDQQALKIIKDQAGATFSIHQGLPRETYAGQGIFTVPDTPHVFQADHFELNSPKGHLVEAKGVNVLLMHGVARVGKWFPLNRALQERGISVEQIVNSFEESSGQSIDVLFVCNPKGESRVKVVPFAGVYQKPRIYMKSGNARGSVNQHYQTGEVTVRMETESEDQAEFLRWKNKGKVRVLPKH